MATGSREVRLGLVLNGGVSLAIWIGGATHEVDLARRAGSAPAADDGSESLQLYGEILTALQQRVVVDVIAGASAGGINGVLLGAAIFNGKPLDGLRETWIGLGDFRKLLRSPSFPNPPSLMKGDEVVLPELEKVLKLLYEGGTPGPKDQDLYLYVTATDLFGYRTQYADTSGRTFEERDNRRVFRFEHERGSYPHPEAPAKHNRVMRSRVWFDDADAADLLARAARSSSSFPVAFEAHRLSIVDGHHGTEKVNRHWLIDGGILDNQPFNPVLDRIAVLPASGPVKRVVMYVVPYVTEIGSTSEEAPPVASARDTYAAAGTLPRNVPKLDSLRRITREYEEQKTAEDARMRLRDKLDQQVLATSAISLFPAYKETRAAAADAVWRLWASPFFRPGHGALAQDPSVDARALAPPPRPVLDIAEAAAEETPPPPWLPQERVWTHDPGRWAWGLGPAERVAIWALMFLRDVEPTDESALDAARTRASKLIATIRATKVELQREFEAATSAPSPPTPLERLEDVLRAAVGAEARKPAEVQADELRPDARARLAYQAIEDKLVTIQSEFADLDREIASVQGEPAALRVQSLLDYEVTRNAISVQDEVLGFPFEFVFASAGIRNSLGHRAHTPGQKLAGMKLGHFAGFLKRSWRANDWLWGRLDGVEHVLRAILDAERLERIPAAAPALAAAAFGPTPLPEALAEERKLLNDLWRENAKDLKLPGFGTGEPAERFVEAATKAAQTRTTNPTHSAACLELCRTALAARIQLRVIDEELRRVAETAIDDLQAGSSQIAGGAFWAGRFYQRDRDLRPSDPRDLDVKARVTLFRELDIGGERVEDETSSRLALDVGSQLVAVAAATFAGDRGGLPAGARGTLASVRGITLASSRLLRLLAQIPWLGAVLFGLLLTLLIVAVQVDNALLGTLVPAFAVLTVVMGVALLTLVTSVFEQSLTKPARFIAYVFLLGVPLGFALLVGWPLAEGWADALEEHVGERGFAAAVSAATLAAALAVLRLVGTPLDRAWAALRDRHRSFSWRRAMLTAYRVAVFLALTSLATGFLVRRSQEYTGEDGKTGWAAIANERLGTVLLILLVAVLLAAALIQELSADSRLRRVFQRIEGR